tara:strand:+ start:459 stop:635 length:177 start_codon:yes stop_codon:yes gene_type:complete
MTIIISNDNNRVEIDVNDNDPIEVQLDYLAGYLAGLRDQGVNIDALDIEYDMEALFGE